VTAIPCKRPKVTIDPHPNGQSDAKVATCHVPACGWTYPRDLQFVALASDAQGEATRHRGEHKRAVPETRIVRDVEWDAYCQPCGGHRRTLGTRAEAETWLAEHLRVEHGVVTC
jgi:hypothetical protein